MTKRIYFSGLIHVIPVFLALFSLYLRWFFLFYGGSMWRHLWSSDSNLPDFFIAVHLHPHTSNISPFGSFTVLTTSATPMHFLFASHLQNEILNSIIPSFQFFLSGYSNFHSNFFIRPFIWPTLRRRWKIRFLFAYCFCHLYSFPQRELFSFNTIIWNSRSGTPRGLSVRIKMIVSGYTGKQFYIFCVLFAM